MTVRPNGSILVVVNRGPDATAVPARTTRDLGAIQLTSTGVLDATYGTGGLAVSSVGISLNPRHGVLHPDGRFVVVGYGNATGQPVRPHLVRFLANGTLDGDLLVIGRGDYHWQHEPCWYVVRKGRPGKWAGDRKQSTLWNIDKPSASE